MSIWSGLDDSPTRIRALLADQGLALKKRWGQNFMINGEARRRIVDLLDVSPTDHVWEIGSGLGALTALLTERANRVTVFEVDHGLAAVIAARFGHAVSIVMGDAVSTLVAHAGEQPERIIGNLPYRSAAAIITTTLEHPALHEGAKRLVFTVQREMAARMVAGPGTKDYSPLSILCALTAETRRAGDLSHGNFYPAPDVVSSIVVMNPVAHDRRLRRDASRIARGLFASRRKTIGNNLSATAAAIGTTGSELGRAVEEAGASRSQRAEELPPAVFLEIARSLFG